MPARGQHQQRAFRYMHLEQCRVVAVEPGQNLGSRQIVDVYLTMFPEMNPGESSEAGLGERRQERVFEFDTVEHGIRADVGLLRFDGLNPCKGRYSFSGIRGLDYQQDGPAAFEISANRIDAPRRDCIGGGDQVRGCNVCFREIFRRTGNDRRLDRARSPESPLNVIQHALEVTGAVTADKKYVDLLY